MLTLVIILTFNIIQHASCLIQLKQGLETKGQRELISLP